MQGKRSLAQLSAPFMFARSYFATSASFFDAIDPESPFNQPEEVVIIDTDSRDFLTPTVAFDVNGNLELEDEEIREQFDVLLDKINLKAYSKAQSSVGRLRVSFSGKARKSMMYPTCYMLSPTIIFTDRHCVPPTWPVFTKNRKVREVESVIPLHRVQVRFDVNAAADSHWETKGIELKPVSSSNEWAKVQTQIDPLNGREWPRGKRNVDLAVLSTNYPLDNYLFPASIDTDKLQEGIVDVGFIGYPKSLDPVQFESLYDRLSKQQQLPEVESRFRNFSESILKPTVYDRLNTVFHDFRGKILSIGHTLKAKVKPEDDADLLVAVTNTSTTCTSGSPYHLIGEPKFVVGQQLGGGVWSREEEDPYSLNYNLMMSVNNPEWVYKYAKYVFPTLPPSAHEAIRPYMLRHKEFLHPLYLFPSILE